jgi:hypothetical protein
MPVTTRSQSRRSHVIGNELSKVASMGPTIVLSDIHSVNVSTIQSTIPSNTMMSSTSSVESTSGNTISEVNIPFHHGLSLTSISKFGDFKQN